MKKAFIFVGLPALISTATVLGLAGIGSAQSAPSRFTRPTAGRMIAQQAITPEAPDDTVITPDTEPDALPSEYGIVRSVSGDTISVRTLDGTNKTLSMSTQVATSGDLSGTMSRLQKGDLIGFDTDESGAIVSIAPPPIEETIEGTVSAIEDDQVTILSSTGESVTTTVQPSTAARMGLTTGRDIVLTKYQGTWATKICSVDKAPTPAAAPAPEPVRPIEPEPPSGGGFQPEPEVIPGLW